MRIVKITGDVDFDKVIDKCKYVTPVPGGVEAFILIMSIYDTLIQME